MFSNKFLCARVACHEMERFLVQSSASDFFFDFGTDSHFWKNAINFIFTETVIHAIMWTILEESMGIGQLHCGPVAQFFRSRPV